MVREEHVVATVGAVGGTGASSLLIGIPNPISVALYALISTVVGWLVAQALAIVKKKLGL